MKDPTDTDSNTISQNDDSSDESNSDKK
jgi:hypothetical protein